jgi:O-antigen biosynthesis protein
VVPLYNCLPLTQAMFASLEATLPAGLGTEIILVDDGSTDGTREWLAALENSPDRWGRGRPALQVVLNERNLGYARANNRGVALARGEFVALLNNDLVLLPRWLEPMLKAHRRLGAHAGVIGNVQLDATSGAVDHAGIVINVQGKPVHARALPPPPARWLKSAWRIPAVTGACMLLRRRLWLELGGFDEAFVNGGEDIDLCFRARAAGRVNVVALRSVVRHHVSSSPGRKLRDEENSYRLAQRWGREFLVQGDHGRREWCRSYLAAALVHPRSHEYKLALHALSFLSRLRRSAPAEAVNGVAAGLAREFARWEGMFADRAERPSPSAPLRE